jgi:hypothetical protein
MSSPLPHPALAEITASLCAELDRIDQKYRDVKAENAQLRGIIEHAHNASRRFIDNNKNTGKYFLHICDILKPHVKDTTHDQ